MSIKSRTSYSVIGVAALAMFALSACSNDTPSASMSSPAAAMTTTAPSMDSPTPSMDSSGSTMADPAANLVGPGCAAYAAAVPTGAGSVQGMSGDPVATAASNNPMLTTLAAAVSGKLNPNVNLVDTLNAGKITVFAPVDDAFAAVDPATIESLKTDTATLTKILTYHVVAGEIAPDQLKGDITTLEGDTVKVTGSGDNLMINDAKVICGGVQTQNATVYMIDKVLTPSK